ncbi:hypothetical protein bcgnr5390_11910 [Bacillus luti]|nr:hypothetical protein BC2903_28990 [Bacillus cereus]
MKKFVLGMSFAALLTGFVNAPGENNVAHAAEKKLWNPIPNYTHKDEPISARNFYYDTGDINEKEMVSKKVLYLERQFQLKDKYTFKSTDLWLAPQLVEVLDIQGASDGYLLEVKTWLGSNWIHWSGVSKASDFPIVNLKYPASGKENETFQSISNKIQIPIYKSPNKNGVIEGYISPQELEVTSVGLGDYAHLNLETSALNGYIGIKTWLGERWVKANDIDTEDINKYIFPVTKGNEFALLDSPERITNLEVGFPHMAVQEVFAIQRKGPFLKVRTWLGDKWIEADEYIDNFKENESFSTEKVLLNWDEKIDMYDQPDYQSTKNSFPFKNLLTLTGTYKKDNGEIWYYVYGGKWIPATDVNSITEATGVLKNKESLDLLDKYFSAAYVVVDPQTLHFKKKLGNYYLIDTWLGDMWVHKKVDDEVIFDEKDLTLLEATKLYKTPVKIESQILGEVPAQVVKEVSRKSWNGQKWIQVKIPSTNQEGWILEV